MFVIDSSPIAEPVLHIESHAILHIAEEPEVSSNGHSEWIVFQVSTAQDALDSVHAALLVAHDGLVAECVMYSELHLSHPFLMKHLE